MPRSPRIEYAGAVYHVMCRGDHREAIFRGDEDRRLFLETLGQVCERTGWRIHGYVLMPNHYHLLLETPSGGLVAGMRWFQTTYTARFNARHRLCGHLFQGRYKAIPVEPGGEYFLAVATYSHLNPMRMKGYEFETARPEDYAWSSYPGYVQKRKREPWLCADRVLAALQLGDTSAGRARFGAYMLKRVLEVRHADKPWEADGQWKRIRRGWYFGGEDFRGRMMEGIEHVVTNDKGTAFGGRCIQEHHERQASRLLSRGLEALRLREADLAQMRKSSPEKCALAWLIRKRTSVKTDWIKRRLHMGTATNFSVLLKKAEGVRAGMPGYEEMKALRNIKI